MLSRSLSLLILTAGFAAAADATPVVVKLAGLKSEAPAEWKKEKPSNALRSYQFKLPAGVPDTPDAEISVMADSDKNVEKVFPRWKNTFEPPEGKTVDDIAKVTKGEVAGGKFTVLDVTGTWKYKERPFDPKSKEELRPDYRVIWVVLVDKDDDAVHVRLSGPAAVVEKYKPGFDAWIKAAK